MRPADMGIASKVVRREGAEESRAGGSLSRGGSTAWPSSGTRPTRAPSPWQASACAKATLSVRSTVEQTSERGPRETELTRGGAHVASVPVHDSPRLIGGERHALRSTRQVEAVGDVLATDDVTATRERGSVEHVAELADVARPSVGGQPSEGARAEIARAHLALELGEEARGEKRNVAPTLSQGRHVDDEHR